jgi:uncharacterized protein
MPGLREKINTALKEAMRARDAVRLGTLRLIGAAIKDRDIVARGEGRADGVTDAEIVAILARMVKQRQESIRAYEEGGRLDLAEGEAIEIAVIEGFLPRQLTEAETAQAIDAAIAETGAAGVRDIGRVMALLKERHTGTMDFAAAGARVKARLG